MNGANVFPFGINTASINSAATTNATLVKSVSGALYSFFASNNGVADAYLKFYNKSTAPNVGVDTPFFIVVIPANGHVQFEFGSQGLTFENGIAFAITNLMPDADATAVAGNQVKAAFSWM